MASQKFVMNLTKLINKQLNNVLAGPPNMTSVGSNVDQSKGLGEDLRRRIVPFAKTSYEAQELLVLDIPLKDPNISKIHYIAPILNVKGKSVQGVSSFMAITPHPIPETYIHSMVGLSHKLVPHSLAVDQGIKPKKIVKEGMITHPGLTGVNANKKLCKAIGAFNFSCDVEAGGLSKSVYKIKYDYGGHIPGGFTVVPYNGQSIMIVKDAGAYGSKADSPKYNLAKRYEAFSGVAQALASHPQAGEPVGTFYMDGAQEALLAHMLGSGGAHQSAPQQPPSGNGLNWGSEPAPTPPPQQPQLQPQPQAPIQPPMASQNQIIACPGCNNTLQLPPGQPAFTCPYCSNSYSVPSYTQG